MEYPNSTKFNCLFFGGIEDLPIDCRMSMMAWRHDVGHDKSPRIRDWYTESAMMHGHENDATPGICPSLTGNLPSLPRKPHFHAFPKLHLCWINSMAWGKNQLKTLATQSNLIKFGFSHKKKHHFLRDRHLSTVVYRGLPVETTAPAVGSPVFTGSTAVRWPSTWTTKTLMAMPRQWFFSGVCGFVVEIDVTYELDKYIYI